MLEEALGLLKTLFESGYEAYIVGGFVRDYLIDKKSIDIDICTNAKPKEIKEIFDKVILKNVNYGSVTVIKNKIRFEITTYRKDIGYINNRVPKKIKYINNLKKDLKRRDFTINTICMDKDSNIIDMLNGRKDLDNKLIKMIGNPRIRLKEDALRILRAIRFSTVLDFDIDKKLEKYIKKYGYLLKDLSYDRKKIELDKIFASENAKKGIDLIKKLSLDKYLELSNLDNLVIAEPSIIIWSELNVTDIYPFTSLEKETIKRINELKNKSIISNDNLYHFGLYISILVGTLKKIDKKLITAQYNKLPIHSKKDINIKANEICNLLNKKEGPFLNEIFNDLEYNILMMNLLNENSEIKNYILKNYR